MPFSDLAAGPGSIQQALRGWGPHTPTGGPAALSGCEALGGRGRGACLSAAESTEQAQARRARPLATPPRVPRRQAAPPGAAPHAPAARGFSRRLPARTDPVPPPANAHTGNQAAGARARLIRMRRRAAASTQAQCAGR